MNEILNWAAQHNTLMIQVAFSIVLVLLLIYVYRLFFVASASPDAHEGSSVDFTEVTQKLNQIIEQQKNAPVAPVAAPTPAPVASAPPAGAGSANGPEVEQLKAENTKLKTQLNEAEKKIFELTPIAGPEDSLKEQAPQADPAQITELNKKIEELQSRLSEYDIIADDIAELSQLRAENAEMKKKLGAESGLDSSLLSAVPQAEAEAPVEAVSEEPVPAEESSVEPPAPEEPATIEPLPDIEIAAPVVEEAPVETASAVDTQESADLLKSLVPEAAISEAPVVAEPAATETAATAPENPPEAPVDQSVAEAEKNLINEFEKSQKGS